MLTTRAIEVLLYLHPKAPRPRQIHVPRPSLLRRMHAQGWIDRPEWTMKRTPKITEKGKIVIALVFGELGCPVDKIVEWHQ